MLENNKIFEIIKDIKAGKITLEDVKGEISDLEWNTLRKIMELNFSEKDSGVYEYDGWVRSTDLITRLK